MKSGFVIVCGFPLACLFLIMSSNPKFHGTDDPAFIRFWWTMAAVMSFSAILTLIASCRLMYALAKHNNWRELLIADLMAASPWILFVLWYNFV